nr:MAG TPA: hypothetical protein [Caudoviricetes sp.]
MICHLSKSDFEFLNLKSPESVELISTIENENNEKIAFEVPNDKYSEFESRINDSILDIGLDDEDTVNEIGKRLYSIYDELLYQ